MSELAFAKYGSVAVKFQRSLAGHDRSTFTLFGGFGTRFPGSVGRILAVNWAWAADATADTATRYDDIMLQKTPNYYKLRWHTELKVKF